MPAKLIITNTESGRAFEYEIVNDETRIGRAADRNEVVLNDGQVSRHHVVIKRDGHSYLLVDLNSANGTTFGGMRVKEHVLRDGDLFSISKYNLQFKSAATIAPIKFDHHKIGDTVVMRTPGEIASVVPKIDKAAIRPSDPKSVMDYVEALRKKAETLARIYELNQLLASDFSQEDIFKKVSEMVFRLTTADRFLVLLKDPDTGELTRVAAEFRNATSSRASEDIAISKTVVDRVMAERVSLLSFDTHSDERFAKAQSIVLQNITSVMCAPLMSKDNVLGVIYVDCREAIKLLREDDLELLNAVAAETSIAVDNAATHKRLVREELARAKFRRFMPAHVVDEILKSPNTLSLGGTNSCITVLFSDIRGFTSMSEQLSPQVVVQILNEYFAEMTPIVFEYQGLLDKFMGDGLMALFGVPYACDEAASNAVAAAIAMQRTMAQVNEDLAADGLSEIAIGIGVNTGTATVGYIGSRERTDYTAIGDAVNLAARLEKQAGAGQIIISRSTFEALGGKFPLKPYDQIKVKGKQEPVQIYEVPWREASDSAAAQPAGHVKEVSLLLEQLKRKPKLAPTPAHLAQHEGEGRGARRLDIGEPPAKRLHPENGGDEVLDSVFCTVFAPPSVRQSDTFLVQLFAHLREQAQEVEELAVEFDKDAQRRMVKNLETRIARGTKLAFELRMPGLEIDDPVQSLIWNGIPEAVQFGVRVPNGHQQGVVVGTVIVSQGWAPIGHIKFKLEITAATGQSTGETEPVGDHARCYTKAFVSYASRDRDKVIPRVQMLKPLRIEYFQDFLDLEPGDRWEKKLYLNIDQCDLFLLFWSSAAKESEWVRKEVNYALDRKARNEFAPPEIRPIIIEGPPAVEPWDELADYHFDDRLVYFMAKPGE